MHPLSYSNIYTANGDRPVVAVFFTLSVRAHNNLRHAKIARTARWPVQASYGLP